VLDFIAPPKPSPQGPMMIFHPQTPVKPLQ